MRRALTICILCVFLGYGIVLLSSMNVLGTNKIPYVQQKLKTLRIFVGAGSLFTREVSLDNYATLYRCYQNNHWENWQALEKPLFNKYIKHLSFASLKHTRLDLRLSQGMYVKAYLINKKKFKQSKAYQAFIKHLINAHQGGKTPDSVEVSYQIKKFNVLNKYTPQTLLRFKTKP